MTDPELSSKLASIERKLDALIVTVRGDVQMGAPGHQTRLREAEVRVERLERFRDRFLWYLAGAATGGAGLVQVLMEIFK